MSLLQIQGLRVTYGGVVAVRSLDLTVSPGEAVAILGANGAGKTSVLRAVSGLAPVVAGTMRFDGTDLVGLAPENVARLGLAHVPADRGIFPSLTVHDNLRTALYGAGHHRDRDGDGRGDAALAEVLELFPILAERRDQPAGTLSGGQQQMLTIGRALVQRPRLLMIDELSMGLAPGIVEDLFATVDRLTDAGLAVLLVEQFVDRALRVVDRAVVMVHGDVVTAGAADELTADGLAAAYLGGDGARPPVRRRVRPLTAPVEVALDARARRRLERVAAAEGRSLDEVVRDAIHRRLEEPHR